MKDLYGENIEYKYDLIKPEDINLIQAFSCGNENLDRYIQKELIINNDVDTTDGLPYKVVDLNTNEIIGIFSLAASGIIHRQGNYVHVLPAIKIDIFAINTKYQKIHMDAISEASSDPDDHFYFSDAILCEAIKICVKLSEEKIAVKYILLYADKKAKRFYQRNLFHDFADFMEKEQNMEINKNEPMYLPLD
ncbi:MAG: hypothetical protein MJ134_00530 [Lachnospiraceae bacterium]|nr:hypothetical protein [Lachnospiraceae bacterium]